MLRSNLEKLHIIAELAKAIASLEVDHVLILAEWDRATRSMSDRIKIMERVFEIRCIDKGAQSIVAGFNHTNWIGHLGFPVFACRRRTRTHLSAI